jgi:serine/threonine-protein kinase
MTVEQAIRISETCDRFEWAWRKGAPPRIESVLSAAPPEDRPYLLEDLLRIELELRREAGDCPRAGDYMVRFPAEVELIDRVVREAVVAEDEIPRRFVGKYELLEEIGRGREGVVYRAREEGIVPLEVAVKLLGAGAVGSRADAERFIKEVRAMARIEHDHIVAFRGSGDDRGQLYYVMRYMRGSSLARFLKERGEPLAAVDAVRIMIPIAEAVHHLHAQQPPIVHRDLKPHNILLDEAGHPYVSDFGMAILLDGDGVEGGACGTIPYIAPEQLDGRFGEVGPSSDIYSLGVILYELIAGRPPFPHTRESLLRTLDRDPLPPSRHRAGIPDGLERICLKCLRKATRDRYDSAAGLAAELNRFTRNEPLVETPPHTAWQRVRDWARREPALAARLAVIVACSIIIWGSHLVAGRYAPLLRDHWARLHEYFVIRRGYGSVEAALVWMTQVILVAWGLASWAFQRQLTRKAEGGGLQFGWRLVDVVALSLLIELDDALMSPLTVAFAVLIVASAFWARADQIIQTTILSMSGYAVLALLYRLNHPGLDRPYRHFHYLVGLALLGLILVHQANRTRALARICGARERT